MGGSKQTQTQHQTSNPWGPAQGNLQDILSAGRTYMNDPNAYTPTFSQNTVDAATQMGNLGRTPSTQQQYLPGMVRDFTSGTGDAMSTLRATANGSMLGSNPYLDQVLATSRQRAADQINQQFSGAGRYGSGANTGILADRLGAIETNARMQNYDSERGRQLNAAGLLGQYGMNGAQLAGQLDQSNKDQAGLLAASGNMFDTMDNARRTAGIDAAQRVAGLTVPIAGLGGTKDSNTQTTTPPNWAGIATGLGGAALGAMTGGAGFGLGGALSGLGGFFGGNATGPLGWLSNSAPASFYGSSNVTGSLPKLGGGGLF